MSTFDPDFKRLKIILVVFIFITCNYSVQWFFFVHMPNTITDDNEIPPYVFDPDSQTWIYPENNSFYNETYIKEKSSEFDFFGFMTFTLDAIPEWIKPFYAFIGMIVNIVAIYLLISWIYDWIKALPFT